MLRGDFEQGLTHADEQTRERSNCDPDSAESGKHERRQDGDAAFVIGPCFLTSVDVTIKSGA